MRKNILPEKVIQTMLDTIYQMLHLKEIIIRVVAVPKSQVSALFKCMTNPLAVER